ncbi:MAG: transglutaminase-like domain-containing protein [Vulcanimicrobiaceae bacterium]
MDRRRFLQQGAAFSALVAIPAVARAVPAGDSFVPGPDAWRTFEITTTIELDASNGPAKAWVPLPAFTESEWMRPQGNHWATNGISPASDREPKWGAQMLYVQWPSVKGTPTIVVKSRVSTRDRAVDLSKPGNTAALSEPEHRLYTSPTELIPTDGIVKATADKITAGASSDLDKARRIYDWVIANTFRNPKTRGCGLGNIKFMLESGDFGGKCADINGLYVGLARAAGLPARDLYGIRVAPSRFGYKSLGANTDNITKAQHCRAEVYLTGYGWVPVDPADVRKVVLEEPPGNLPMTSAKVADARATLFGAWEGNWIAYNDAHDIRLPGSSGSAIGFLMYPTAEVDGERLDSLAPDDFKYTIASQQVAG